MVAHLTYIHTKNYFSIIEATQKIRNKQLSTEIEYNLRKRQIKIKIKVSRTRFQKLILSINDFRLKLTMKSISQGVSYKKASVLTNKIGI